MEDNLMYMPKSATPAVATSGQASSGYMPKTAVAVPEKKKTVGGFVTNVGKSAFNVGKDLVSAAVNVFNPNMEKNTVANIAKLGVGTAQLLDPTEVLGTGQQERARAVGRFYDDRYGISDFTKGNFGEGFRKVGNTLYEDPVGALLDASTVAGGAGAVLKGAGAASKVSGLTRAGQTLSRVGATLDPIAQAGGLFSRGASRAADAAQATLKGAGEGIVVCGLGQAGTKTLDALDRAGMTRGQAIRKYKLFDRSSEAAGAAKKAVWDAYDAKAMSEAKNVNVGSVIKGFDTEIEKLQKGVNGLVSEETMQAIRELEGRKQEFLDAVGAQYHSPVKPEKRLTVDEQGVMSFETEPVVAELQSRYMSAVPIETNTKMLTSFRNEFIDKKIPESSFGSDPNLSAKTVGNKAARDVVRKNINATDPALEQLGLDYGVLKNLEKDFRRVENRVAGRQAISLPKLLSTGAGATLAGIPGAIGGFVLEQFVNSPQFVQISSQTFLALEQAVGKARATQILDELSNYTGKPYQVSKTGRLFSEENQSDPVFSRK